MKPQFEQAFAPLTKLAPDTMPFEIVEVDALQPGGSDHSPFIRAGVPGFFWKQDGKSDYDFVHHTQHDTIENVIPQYQKHSAMVVAIAAYQVANLPELVDRRNSAPLPRRRMGGMLDRDSASDREPAPEDPHRRRSRRLLRRDEPQGERLGHQRSRRVGAASLSSSSGCVRAAPDRPANVTAPVRTAPRPHGAHRGPGRGRLDPELHRALASVAASPPAWAGRACRRRAPAPLGDRPLSVARPPGATSGGRR